MNKVDRLLAKGEEIKFGDVKFNIKPLKNKELLEVMKLAEDKKTDLMMTKMIFYSLNRDDPSITMEQVNDLPYMFDFLKVITRVNHLEDLFDFQSKGGRQMPDLKDSQTKSEKDTSQEQGKKIPRQILS